MVIGSLFGLGGEKICEVVLDELVELGGQAWSASLNDDNSLGLTMTQSDDDQAQVYARQLDKRRDELAQRTNEYDSLSAEIEAQMTLAEKGTVEFDSAGAELARLLGAKSSHRQQMQALKESNIDVSFTVRETKTTVVLAAGSLQEFPGAPLPIVWCPRVNTAIERIVVEKTASLPFQNSSVFDPTLGWRLSADEKEASLIGNGEWKCIRAKRPAGSFKVSYNDAHYGQSHWYVGFSSKDAALARGPPYSRGLFVVQFSGGAQPICWSACRQFSATGVTLPRTGATLEATWNPAEGTISFSVDGGKPVQGNFPDLKKYQGQAMYPTVGAAYSATFCFK